MSRRPIFSDFQVKEMKEFIRTGEPIVMLAERLAGKYNVSEQSMRTKLYSLAKRTYKIAEWNGPKRRSTRKAATIQEVEMPEGFKWEGTPKRITLEKDHFKIYF